MRLPLLVVPFAACLAAATAASAAKAPDLSRYALAAKDVRTAVVVYQASRTPQPSALSPVAEYDRRLVVGTGGAQIAVQVGRFVSKDVAKASVDSYTSVARSLGFAQKLGNSMHVTSLTVLRIRPLGAGDQSLEVGYRFLPNPDAKATMDQSIVMVRVRALVQRLSITSGLGQVVSPTEVTRLAKIVGSRMNGG